jgi:ribosomal protein S1
MAVGIGITIAMSMFSVQVIGKDQGLDEISWQVTGRTHHTVKGGWRVTGREKELRGFIVKSHSNVRNRIFAI